MLVPVEVTKMAGVVAAQLPILTGINSDTELDQGLELMDELIKNYDENLIFIEALSNAIARYEDESAQFKGFNDKQEGLDPAVVTLKVLMDQHKLNTTDFESEIGKKSMLSQVLSGKKQLTRDHIANLAKRFSISPALFF